MEIFQRGHTAEATMSKLLLFITNFIIHPLYILSLNHFCFDAVYVVLALLLSRILEALKTMSMGSFPED